MINFDFSNKKALVTGGSHGIGKSILFSLINHKCDVIFFGRTRKMLTRQYQNYKIILVMIRKWWAFSMMF